MSGEEVMTDGGGQISLLLAQNIAFKLNLEYIPSGFQGRFGGAKGLWIIDCNATDQEWIDVYSSQQKWIRHPMEDESHRTFEVTEQVGPLKAANLNLQLILLLENRARNKRVMKVRLPCYFNLRSILNHMTEFAAG
jgi:hypothetical protein